MSNASIRYVIWQSGHRRHHGGTLVDIIPPPPPESHPSNNGTFTAIGFSMLEHNGLNYSFAFLSVNGAADGNHLYTDPGAFSVTVGASDVNALAVYIPTGGGGGGGPALLIDAFNVDTNQFSDSDFVTVLMNGVVNNAVTLAANNDGVVSTTTLKTIRSLPSVDGVPFFEWKKIGGPASTNIDYITQIKEGGIAFAFYKQTNDGSQPNIGRLDDLAKEFVRIIGGVAVDGGGFIITYENGHLVLKRVPPWDPGIKTLLKVNAALLKSLQQVVAGIEQNVKISATQLKQK
ncbi:hypothetical protein GCM10023149_12680 [Mucilaginibacter gynuensis]|uniref:Uncharacterized protein n=1 Tax=Mucilaginibacter gynuensis TaxID=1302236 RepID=A0ABP8G2A5_9SPHI